MTVVSSLMRVVVAQRVYSSEPTSYAAQIRGPLVLRRNTQ